MTTFVLGGNTPLVKGIAPTLVGATDGGSSRARTRNTLVYSWNGSRAATGEGMKRIYNADNNMNKVYDSSVFVEYKKLKAINKNYNDYSFGGSNNGAYSAIMHVRS